MMSRRRLKNTMNTITQKEVDIFNYLCIEENLLKYCKFVLTELAKSIHVEDICYDLRKTHAGLLKHIRINILSNYDGDLKTLLTIGYDGDLKWKANLPENIKDYLYKEVRESKLNKILKK